MSHCLVSLVLTDSPLLLSYTRYLEWSQHPAHLSIIYHSFEPRWADMAIVIHDTLLLLLLPPSLPPSFCLPQTPSYHGMQQRQSTDGLSWKLIRSSHLADLVQTTGGREGGGIQHEEFNAAVNISSSDERVHCLFSSSCSIEATTNFLVHPGQEIPSK